MFTGIVQAVGQVAHIEPGRLQIAYADQPEFQDIKTGESISVSGVCLTSLDSAPGHLLSFDVSGETLHRSNLGNLLPNGKVNLERAMKVNDRFGGHIVQGHVDCVGQISGIKSEGNAVIFSFDVASENDRYLIDKGSITIDGVSFTVVEPHKGRFNVWVIPHTLHVTNLGQRSIGDTVNIEFDVIAKHVEKLLQYKGS